MKKRNEERCISVMEKYLELDRHQKVPFAISAHLLSCEKCRKEVRALKLAEKECSAPVVFKTPLADASIQSVMMKIDPKAFKKFNTQERNFRVWVVMGIVLVLAVFFMVFVSRNFTNRHLLMGIASIIAASVTIYCVFFVVSNLDFFIKRINSSIRA